MNHHKALIFKRLLKLVTPASSNVASSTSKCESEECSFVEAIKQKEDGAVANGSRKKSKQELSDLKNYGTSQGIINVSSLAEAKNSAGKICKTLTSETQAANQNKADKMRFGTSQGIINVSGSQPKKVCVPVPPITIPANKRQVEQYEEDLKRFGTAQGIVNVSVQGKEKEIRLPAIKDFSQQWYERFMGRNKIGKFDARSLNPYADLYKDFPKAQVTIRNNTSVPKEITLWGALPEVGSNQVNYEAIQDQGITATIATGIHPQGMVFNAANGLVYAVNQLSGTVTIVNGQNQVVQTVQLQPSFPGLCSPVAIAANTNPASPKYGCVYVACSVSSNVQIIDPAFQVVATITTGVRPVAVQYNPINNVVYVANLVDNTVSLIDPESYSIHPASPLAAGDGPIGIGIHPLNGDAYICNSNSNDVTVCKADFSQATTITAAGQRPVAATYNPANGYMYVSATDSNEVLRIATVGYSIENRIEVGAGPYTIMYSPANQNMYVENRRDNTLSVISRYNLVIGTLHLGEHNLGGAYNLNTHTIYVSDTAHNALHAISFGAAGTGLSVSSNYAELQADFKSNFAIVQHARFVVSGDERLYNFRTNRFNPTGSRSTRRISMEQYASPQNRQNVTEFTALAGSLIDGKMNWKFMLPAQHTVSVLVWFRQFKFTDLF